MSYTLPIGIEIETFEIRPGARERRNQFGFLSKLQVGEHVHFAKKLEPSLRSSVSRINKIAMKEDPEFYLSVISVREKDPKGPGLRVIRQSRSNTK